MFIKLNQIEENYGIVEEKSIRLNFNKVIDYRRFYEEHESHGTWIRVFNGKSIEGIRVKERASLIDDIICLLPLKQDDNENS